MAGIQMNRTASGVVLPPAVSNEIWQNSQEQSAVMQAARRIDLPGEGVTVSIITGDPVADWVDETAEKPVSRPTLSNKTITGYKLALIVPFSNEFRRDLPTLYGALQRRLPNAIAKKFDQTVFGYDSAPGSNFDTLAGIQTVEFTGIASVNEAAQLVAATEDAGISHTVVASQADFVVGGQVDLDGRPLFPDIDSVYNKYGGQVVRSKHVYDATEPTLGITGDWADFAVWGMVEGIKVKVSDQATINDGGTQLNLWQRNMFALLVEATVGFRTRDSDAFVRYVGAAS